METSAFYSSCFCLSNRVRHDQIIHCTVVIYPNNFKCHGTIFTFSLLQKTHYFLERTHQILTPSNVSAARCRLLNGAMIVFISALPTRVMELWWCSYLHCPPEQWSYGGVHVCIAHQSNGAMAVFISALPTRAMGLWWCSYLHYPPEQWSYDGVHICIAHQSNEPMMVFISALPTRAVELWWCSYLHCLP